MIRVVRAEDAEGICNIYNYYVENTSITFEEISVAEKDMRKRISDIQASFPYYVFEEDGVVTGYAYATKWRSRTAYRFSVETTVYVDKNNLRKGIGTQLYRQLLQDLEVKGFHRAIAGIALPNSGSIALHEMMGFKKVAEFTEVGFKFENWINVGYWEYTF